MPELRDTYDHRAVSNWIIQPPFADLQDRAQQRARRHRAAGTVAVAMLAGLVAVPVLTLPGDDGLPAGQSPPPEESYSFSMEFYDLRHGVGVYQPDDCRLYVSVTRDGGVTWSEPRAVPELPGAVMDFAGEPGCRSDRVIPIAPDTLVLPVNTSTLSREEWVEPLTSALISRDAGATWQELEPQMQTADAVPEGVVPEPHCLADPCQETELGWYDPQTGDPTLLRDNPPAAGAGNAVATVAADDSIWVAGTDAEDGHLVSVSRDRGRGWQTESSGRADGVAPDDDLTFVAADGQTAYLATWPLDQTDAVSAFYRITGDRLTSWDRLSDRPFDLAAEMWVAPDGTLVVLDDDWRAHVSTDRGETFQDADLRVLDVKQIAGGFFGWASDASDDQFISGYLSEDGLDWRRFEVSLGRLTAEGQVSD